MYEAHLNETMGPDFHLRCNIPGVGEAQTTEVNNSGLNPTQWETTLHKQKA